MNKELLESFAAEIVFPGLQRLEGFGGPKMSHDAIRMLLAIALQESGIIHRYQVVNHGLAGPARGWWQFECKGGVAGVMAHPRSQSLARIVCARYFVEWEREAIWRALEGHDGLSTAFARLLLWTDAGSLPRGEEDGWHTYLRNWRPGRPHPAAWSSHWALASEVIER